MIIAEELISEYMEHYEVDRVKAIDMALEDLKLAEKELKALKALEMQKGGGNSGG